MDSKCKDIPSCEVVNKQPGKTSENVVISQPKSERMWSSEICSCFEDIEICLWSTFFPQCYLCCMYMEYNECFCSSLLVPNSLMALRIQHRNRHGIKGTICDDCIKSTCYGPCTMCQLKRDMKHIISTKGSLIY
uniref:Placenta specific protein 8 n=1 Tax=Dugesia japonica TaxID=6161 RepID=A0A0P0DI19_DUGJA|nr:placenta specific protein 8 [Dugesia japonica]